MTFGYRSLPFNEIPLFFFLSLLFLPFRKIEGENEFFGNAIELIMRSLSSEIYYIYIYIYVDSIHWSNAFGKLEIDCSSRIFISTVQI